MDLIRLLVDLVLHLDRHLAEIIAQFGVWTYAILFLVVFCETGLVATPFLPGDSLLFATGTFCALGSLKIGWMIPLICVAAVLGDTVNYWIGHWMGPRVFTRDDVWWLNKRHLLRAQRFYEKHGGKTIILARFIPIIRTFAPFVAGIGAMSYRRFLAFNVVGGCVWVTLFLLAGYFFGNIPIVKNNFSLVIIAIIVISVVPIGVEWLRGRREAAAERAARSQEPG